jgi:hypothetical protein
MDAEGLGNGIVTTWFGDGFARLHPLLQALHRNGGRLGGEVTLYFGKGLAGLFGRRLARSLGVPDVAGTHRLDVQISHDERAMSWDRCFDRRYRLHSSFCPEGRWPDGRWIEKTGAIELALTVDVIEGGWHWRVVGARLHGLPLPLWLVPRSHASKRIEEGRYRFFVGFSLPLVGPILSYGGLLELEVPAAR